MMIRKILIAEDHESTNISVQKTLEELQIVNSDYVFYCDDAITKIEKALQVDQSYDLLITDLSFEKDHRKQKVTDGESLILQAKKIQPDLKILVFSAESRPVIIDKLFTNFEIDGFVRKARGDAKELKKAITAIDKEEKYYALEMVQLSKQSRAYQFSSLDILILSQMIEGKKQQEISVFFKDKNIQPSSLSSIEKRLNLMKESFAFATNEQLIAHCVKMGIV